MLSLLLSLSSESNRGRHAKMTGEEEEREGGNNRTENSARSAAVIIHPALPNICGGWGRSQSRRKEHRKSHLSGAGERAEGASGLRWRATYWRRERRESRIHLSSLLAAVAVERERGKGIHFAPPISRTLVVGSFAVAA